MKYEKVYIQKIGTGSPVKRKHLQNEIGMMSMEMTNIYQMAD